jgi:hypothetical protein
LGYVGPELAEVHSLTPLLLVPPAFC